REFVQTMSLHDADYLGWGEEYLPGKLARLAFVVVKLKKRLIAVLYQLDGEPSENHLSAVKKPRVFDATRPQWLYDEFDVTDAGAMTHEILLSNGCILKFRFSHFWIRGLPAKFKFHAITKLSNQGKVTVL